MKKPIIAGLLILLVGFFLWRMVASEFFNPSDNLAVQKDKENFEWFVCSNCSELYMAEATTRKGYCPYCGFQTMLVAEARRVLARSADESEFVWFFSPECGNVFFAHDTGQMGTCPYCDKAIDLTAPVSTDLDEPPTKVAAWAKARAKGLFAGALVVFAVSMSGFYILRERQIILSLNPIDESVSRDMKIELSRHQARKKKLTLANSEDADIVLKNPSLKDLQFILSFVRVGGKTHSYLQHGLNETIQVNEKKEYNPRLKDHDKVHLGDVEYEVYARED